MPAFTEHQTGKSSSDEHRIAARVKQNLSILIVDDDANDRILLEQKLSASGLDTSLCHCPDLQSAYHELTNGRADVILLDYLLGEGATGPENIGQLLNIANDPHLPVIVLTGYGDEHKAVEAFKEGAADYLSKSEISVDDISRAIVNAVDKADMARELEQRRAAINAANIELQERNEQIRAFYRYVSHELKAPLAGAREFSAMTLEGLGGELSSSQCQWLQHGQRCLGTLGSLIDDLLDTAAVEHGTLSLNIECCDISDIAMHCIRYYKFKATKKDISLELVQPFNLPLTDCDPLRIEQLIANLLGNAIKFTDAGGAVRLELSANGEQKCLEITVRDTGHGVHSDDESRIFQRYTKAKQHEQKNMPGMGLGLYLCKKIVEMHNGHISVTSTLGKGSKFQVLLPLQHVRSH